MFLNIIKKRGKKYHLVSHKGKTLGVHATREEALKQERAIEIAKHAKQLTENIACFLAEQDRDEKGRFSGPGGSGSDGKPVKEDKPTHTYHDSSSPARRHWNDAIKHSSNAESAAIRVADHEWKAKQSGTALDKEHVAKMHEEAAGHFRKEAESWKSAAKASHPDSRIHPGEAKSKGWFKRMQKSTEERAKHHETRAADLRKESAADPQKKLPGF